MKPQFQVDGGSIPITDGMVLGRSPECEFQLNAQGVSRAHARLRVSGEQVEIEDLGSSNGTRVNRQKIEGRQRLAPGDLVQIGRAELTFGTSDQLEPTTKRIKASRDPHSLIGELVAGHRITELLGRGRLGATYRAKQLRMDRNVAFKAFWSDLAAKDPTTADHLIAQVQQASTVSDPSIAQLHHCGREEDLLWYTSELVDGDELTDLMAREGRIPIELALLVAERTARGLQAAHERGVIHGDVRPGAVRITRSGNVKVLDLGLDGLRRALKGGVASSAAHTAPEVSEGALPDERADVYGLGCTLFHLLCGRPPYTASDAATLMAAHRDQPIPVASELRSGLPAQIDELIHGMLAKRPDWRFQSMDELIGDLTRLRESAARGEFAAAAAAADRPGSQPRLRPTSEARPRSSELRATRGRDHRRKPPIAQLVVVAGAIILLVVFLPQIKHLLGQAGQAGGLGLSVVEDPSPAAAPADPVAIDPPADPAAIDPSADPVAIDPPATDPAPVAPPPAPIGDPLREQWQATVAKVADAVAVQQWNEAEQILERFQRQAEATAGSTLHQAAASRLRTLRLDADRWFQQAVDELPPRSDQQLEQRLVRLDQIRRRVIRANRSEAEIRYQQAADQLRRRLARAQQEALRALESGALDRLEGIAASIAEIFAGTPLAVEQQRFATAASEASRLDWSGDWTSTRQAFASARGQQALAAAGALLLIDDRGTAAGILLGDRGIGPDLAARRDALLAATSRRLAFDSPVDLQSISVRRGEPSLGEHGLTGPAGEPVGIDLNEALGRSWQLSLVLSLRPSGSSEGNATVSVVGADGPVLAINLQALAAGGEATASAGSARGRSLVGDFRNLELGLSCADGQLSATINGRELLAPTPIEAASGHRASIDVADAEWTLRELRVVGAR